jgi:hexosaminidase
MKAAFERRRNPDYCIGLAGVIAKVMRAIVILLPAMTATAAPVARPALIPEPAQVEWREEVLSGSVLVRVERIEGLPREGYELEISAAAGAVIRASSDAGEFYARQTLRQLQAADGSIPCVSIRDAPRFPWRGLMLDSSRHFQTVDEIKRWLDLLAMHKLNVFHWHLTDDHGWRFESKKFPLLTKVGAWREQPPIGRYGGFYTQEEMREVVAHAAKLHITVVPEIEMPGHSRSVLAAYPDLACGDTRTEVDRFFDFPMGATTFPTVPGNNVFCAGDEGSFRLLEGVLAEVIEIFPSRYIHCGGDEVGMAAWNGCADCQAVMKSRKLADGHKLQAYFMGRIESFLKAHGRKMIGWDEILEGGLTPEATVMSWRGTAGGIAAAKSGHDAVMSPEAPLYFDHRQSTSPLHPPGFGGNIETLEEVYAYDPVPKELTAEEARHILGTQANLWSCATETEERLQLFAFPRLCALAEIAWCAPAPKDFVAFKRRLDGHLVRLEAMGVNYWKDGDSFDAGRWSPDPKLKAGTMLELTVEQPLKAGQWTAAFHYEGGADALTIDQVELLADGKVVASDAHEGTAGSEHKGHQYRLEVTELKQGAKVMLRAKVRVTPWSGGGEGDSMGRVSLSRDEAIRLYAPEGPLPEIRATTAVPGEGDGWMKRHREVMVRMKANPPATVVIGASVVEAWEAHAESWSAAFSDGGVANFGFRGDHGGNVLWRIGNGELEHIAPSRVIVFAGMDGLDEETPEQILAGTDAICRAIRGKLPEVRILVIGVLPRADGKASSADPDTVNHLLQTRLHPRPGIDVLDPGNAFRTADGTVDAGLFDDGVLPNVAGYRVLAKALSGVK